jgi:hypothetical protein
MSEYIWEFSGFGPRIGVTKEVGGSIFLRDKKRPYKAWWNGGGINEGTATLEESKRAALEYARDYAIRKSHEAALLINEAAKAVAEIDRQLEATR